MTILFADVSGFTAMSERLDPETVRDIMDGCFQVLTEQIQNYGGTIDKFIGDAVMALFGAPVSHGDDPERAVRAALGMQSSLRVYSDELEESRGVSLGIRVGINTGRVVWGRVGGSAGGTFTVMGDAVNLASRLESAAAVGGVLIGEATYRRVQRIFEVDTLDPIRVKGKSDLVRVYAVKGERSRAAQRLSGPRTPFINRQDEINLLHESVERAREDLRAVTVTFRSVPGMGKSRLIAEFRGEADDEGFRVLVARAPAFGQGSIWAPWEDLLVRAAALRRGRSRANQRDQLRDWLARALPPEGSQDDSGTWKPILELLAGVDDADDPVLKPLRDAPKRLRQAILDGAPSFFEAVASWKPTILIAEDLQWWPEPALQLLARLAGIRARLVVVGTARKELETLHWPPSGDRHHDVELRRLQSGEIVELVGGILGDPSAVTPWLALRVTDLSGGNPFFAEELVSTLLDQGVIESEDDAWVVHEERLGSEALPETVEALIQARLDRLSSEDQRIIQKAAAAGRVFWDGLLREGMSEPDAETALQHLVAADFVYPRKRAKLPGVTEYAFRQALIREVAYENTLKRHRRENHRSIADWITEVADVHGDEYAETLAAHYLKAEEPNLALPHLVTAGERAFAGWASREAEGYLVQALDILSAGVDAPELLMRCRLTRGRICRLAGRIEEALEDLTAAVELAKNLRDFAAASRGCIEMAGSYYQRAVFEKVEELAERALDHARSAHSRTHVAIALNLLAMAARATGDYERALNYYADAIDIDEAEGNRNGVGIRLGNMGVVHLEAGNYDEASECFRASLNEPIGRHVVSIVLSNLGLALLLTGDGKNARESLERALEEARVVNYQVVVAEATSRLGAAKVATGEVEEGLEQLAEGVQHAIRLQLHEKAAEGHWLRGRALLQREETERARRDFRACLEIAELHGLRVWKVRGEDELAKLDGQCGEGAA